MEEEVREGASQQPEAEGSGGEMRGRAGQVRDAIASVSAAPDESHTVAQCVL